ncbi:MAG: hypothetical protein FJX63_11130, partial [Alphaproteobacteria bacterium]|nr:hypothetical protein [Alphaproteobacteria bacterium]
MRLGFIGTGSLASFFVEGLARAGAGYDIMVSPRNAVKAAELARRFGVAIAENVDIVRASDLVVVSVLPQQAGQVLPGLPFREGQTVLSVMAGIGHSAITQLVAPATTAVAMMPGHANALNVGPSVLFPDNRVARAMLEKLGPVHVLNDARAYGAASVMGAFSGMSILMMGEAMAWFENQGLTAGEARRLVAETLKGNAEVMLQSPLPAADVARGVVTPGGI